MCDIQGCGQEDAYLEAMGDNIYLCIVCQKRVPRKDNAKRHVRLKHLAEEGEKMWKCEVCQRNYKTNLSLDQHKRQSHGLYKSFTSVWEIIK